LDKQLREARRLEMENNPNYLKPDSSKRNNETNALVNDIEAQSLTNIPGNLRFRAQPTHG
jgi:hypothetical protein